MKRQLIFDIDDGKYVLKENNNIIFVIDAKELKFVSLEFYNSVYKNKSAAIELINAIRLDEYKKGSYIFAWLSEIVSSIQMELKDPEIENSLEEQVLSKKIVYLYELSACAGDGFYSDGPSCTDHEIDSPYLDADYAVRISGKSMEPTIDDQSVVFVKRVDELHDGDVGIFVVNGEVMCKRFRKKQQQKWLQPDNTCGDYASIELTDSVNCIIQGKVLQS